MRATSKLLAALAVAAVPMTAGAERADLELGALYGIGQSSGVLVRYDLYFESLESLGPVHLSDGQALEGIGASAYRQGFSSFVAFWPDPSTGEVRLVNIDLETAEATFTPYTIDSGHVSGATAVRTAGSAESDNS